MFFTIEYRMLQYIKLPGSRRHCWRWVAIVVLMTGCARGGFTPHGTGDDSNRVVSDALGPSRYSGWKDGGLTDTWSGDWSSKAEQRVDTTEASHDATVVDGPAASDSAKVDAPAALDAAKVDAPGAHDVSAPDASAPCFPAGTLVRMANGETQAIESISVGDRIMALDAPSGRVVPGNVTGLIYNKDASTLVALSFSAGGSLITVLATPGHRFFVGDYMSTKEARALALSDEVFVWGADDIGTATLVQSEEVAVPAKVFSFEVEKYHNYFANGVLVRGSSNCFAEGTAITLGNGGKRAIEHVRVGDEVLTVAARAGLVARKVIRTHVYRDRPAVMMVVSTEQGAVTIRAGRNHRFFMADMATPVAAHQLVAGDQLLMRNGGRVTRARLLWSEPYRERGALHDLEIEGADGYFADDILVRDMK